MQVFSIPKLINAIKIYKMKRAIYFLLLTICLLLSAQMSAQSFTYNYKGVDFKCKVKKGKVSIIAFDRMVPNVIIPSKVKAERGREYDVTTLDLYSEAYTYRTEKVVIEQGVKEINEFCFLMFKDLSSVTIPEGVEKIGKKAFNKEYEGVFNLPQSISEGDLLAGKRVYIRMEHGFPGVSETVPETNRGEVNVVESDVEAIVQGTSDVDVNIPFAVKTRENTFCIIIANENYELRDTPGVNFAAQDGSSFYNYCIRTLGLPKENVKMKINAKYLEMKRMLDWIVSVGEVYGDEANFIVYYSGHGIPDEKGNCKLVPVDVSINDANNGFGLADLYASLGELTSKSSLVLIDACFSGNDRSNVTALNAVQRGIVRNLKEDDITGNVIVMTAASSTQTALSFDDKEHGLFSYYLMKKLQETKGDVTLGDLFYYVKTEVERKSTVVLEKKQTPSISVSKSMTSDWKNIKF